MKIPRFSILALALLMGCTPEVAQWTPSESPKENKVIRMVFTHTIHYPSQTSSLGDIEKRNLQQFLKNKVSRPSSVFVILHEQSGHSDVRIKNIQRELLRHGIPFDQIQVENEQSGTSITHHTRRKGTEIEVIIEQYAIIPPSCANFSQSLGDAQQAYTYGNFGCADAVNFGMMLANPRDLIQGRSVGDSSGKVMADGVRRYYQDNIKPLMETSTTTAPGSSQAQNSPSNSPSATSSGGSGAAGAY